MHANERLVRAYVDALGARDPAALKPLFHDDALLRGAEGEPTIRGLLEDQRRMREAFPDRTVTLEDVVFDGEERAVVRLVERGTSRGPFLGFAATGRRFEVTTTEWLRIADGKIRERSASRDGLAILRQIGADTTGSRRSSRALLIGTAVPAIGGAGLFLLDASSVRRWLDDAARMTETGPAGGRVGLMAGLVLAALVWALVRPKDGVRTAMIAPAVAVLAGFWPELAATAASSGGASGGVTLGETVSALGSRLVQADALVGTALYGASLAACVVGLAVALRARALGLAPRNGVRVFLVPPLALASTIGGMVLVGTRCEEAHVLVPQVALAGVTALASATTLAPGEDPACARDAVVAALWSVTGILLGLAAVSTSAYLGGLHVDSATYVDFAAGLRGSVVETAHRARWYLLPALVAALLGARWRAAPVREALREVLGPMLVLALVTGTLAFLLHGAVADVLAADRDPSLGPMEPRLAGPASCETVRLDDVVRSGAGGLVLAGGPAPAEPDAQLAQLDRRAPDADLWVDMTADATPFRALGELMAAAGRARGPRGLAVSSGVTEPPRGCAVVFVGSSAAGRVTCSEAVPLAVRGCIPGPDDGRTLFVSLHADRTVSLEMRPSGVKQAGSIADLTEIVTRMHMTYGNHRDATDRDLDRATLAVDPSVSQRDFLDAYLAMQAADRPYLLRYDHLTRRPAFMTSIALAGASAR